MKSLFVFLSIYVVLLPLSIAEGQVKINPVYEEDLGLSPHKTVANDRWIVISLNSGNAMVVRERATGKESALWLDNGPSASEYTSDVFLHGDILIAGGSFEGGEFSQYRGDVVGIWDLNDPMPIIERTRFTNWESNPYGRYIPQNLTISHKNQKSVFFVEINNLIGVHDADGWITLYDLFGNGSPVQEIFLGDGETSFSSGENFFVASNTENVSLYKYDSSIGLYEHVGIYHVQAKSNYTSLDLEYGGSGQLGLSVTSSHLYLVVGTNRSFLEVIEISAANLKTTKRTLVNTDKLDGDYILASDGEFAVIGDKVFHIPSASFIGDVSFKEKLNQKTGHKVSACIRDLGLRVEIFTTETLHNEYGYISAYIEPVFSVSMPKKVRKGQVIPVTPSGRLPKVLRGGDAALAIVADDGKKIRFTKQVGSSKKTLKKEVGGLIYRINNIRSDTGLERVKFSKADMEEHFVNAAYISIIGKPVPDGEPKKRSYELPVGSYVGIFESPTPGEVPRMVEIRVKPKKVKVVNAPDF